MHYFCMLVYVLLSREGVNYIILNALWRRFSPIPRVYFSILVSAVVFHNNFITPHESQTKHLPKAHQFTLSLRLEAECHLNLEGGLGAYKWWNRWYCFLLHIFSKNHLQRRKLLRKHRPNHLTRKEITDFESLKLLEKQFCISMGLFGLMPNACCRLGYCNILLYIPSTLSASERHVQLAVHQDMRFTST